MASHDFTVHVDLIAYSLSPYGGLITYWDEVLPRLNTLGCRFVGDVPPRLRAALPIAPELRSAHTRPDLFVSTYYTLGPDASVPSLAVVHDVIYEDDPTLPQMLGDDDAILERKRVCIERSQGIVCPSRTTALGIARHYPSVTARVTVVRHGVADVFSPAPDEPADRTCRSLLSQHGVCGRYMLHVGGRQAYKRFDLVLEAFQQTRDPNLSLVVVGSEPTLSSAELALIGDPGRVAFLGHVSREILASLYRGCRAVICASDQEGFGLVPVEARACGATVICSDIAPYRENGAPAVTTFAAGDPYGLSQAIRRIEAASSRPALGATHTRRWADATRELADCLALAAAAGDAG